MGCLDVIERRQVGEVWLQNNLDASVLSPMLGRVIGDDEGATKLRNVAARALDVLNHLHDLRHEVLADLDEAFLLCLRNR
jgi:hypothetical protein